MAKNKYLTNNRNDKILYRYVYYMLIKKYTYIDLIVMLGIEFDLTKQSLNLIIKNSADKIKLLRGNKIADAKNKYPFFNWN